MNHKVHSVTRSRKGFAQNNLRKEKSSVSRVLCPNGRQDKLHQQKVEKFKQILNELCCYVLLAPKTFTLCTQNGLTGSN